jgi:hypothetical protein
MMAHPNTGIRTHQRAPFIGDDIQIVELCWSQDIFAPPELPAVRCKTVGQLSTDCGQPEWRRFMPQFRTSKSGLKKHRRTDAVECENHYIKAEARPASKFHHCLLRLFTL